MGKSSDELQAAWSVRLLGELPQEVSGYRQSIVRWLVGKNLEQLDRLTPAELAIAQQEIDYRYRILRRRYLRVEPAQAYRHLIQRLTSLVMLRPQFHSWVAQNPDHQKAVVDLLPRVIEELLQRDPGIQQQIAWVARCTQDSCLANALLLTSLEEYCLRPLCNHPLLIHHLVSFLRHQWQTDRINGLQLNILDLISEVIPWEQAQTEQIREEKRIHRIDIQRSFEHYLAEKVSIQAVDWLKLHLQGRSREAIAQSLDLSIKQVERLQQTVSYHAIQLFALQKQTEMAAQWLA